MPVMRCKKCLQPVAGHKATGSLCGERLCTNFLALALTFHQNQDSFRIESKTESMNIDRITGAIQIVDKVRPEQGDVAEVGPRRADGIKIVGLVGFLNLVKGRYIILAKEKVEIGEVGGMKIFRVSLFEIFPFRPDANLSAAQQETERNLTSMVLQILDTPSYYYSSNADLSHTRQRVDKLRTENLDEFLQKSLLERCDRRFVYNYFLLNHPYFHANNDLSTKAQRFCVLLCHGTIQLKKLIVEGRSLTVALVSRRSTERVGTRLNVRGVDQYGHVANFVETEQLVEVDRNVASFLQSRGSIPLVWSQIPEKRRLYINPEPTLDANANHRDPLTRHFRTQVGLYKNLVALNLIKHQGAEGALETKFRETLETAGIKEVLYFPFDFNRQCAMRNWEQLHSLLDGQQLIQYQEQYGYFLQSSEGVNLVEQSGVFRTNCIDCLDRTNVAQSLLARRNFQAVLVRLGFLNVVNNEVEQVFRDLWVKNGDVLSEQHSGTAAKYSQITATGAYNVRDQLEDQFIPVKRHLKNNLVDGNKQDSMDVLVGNYRVETGAENTPPVGRQMLKKFGMGVGMAFFAVLILAIIYILPTEFSPWLIPAIPFCGAVVLGCLMMVGLVVVGRDVPSLPPPLPR